MLTADFVKLGCQKLGYHYHLLLFAQQSPNHLARPSLSHNYSNQPHHKSALLSYVLRNQLSLLQQSFLWTPITLFRDY